MSVPARLELIEDFTSDCDFYKCVFTNDFTLIVYVSREWFSFYYQFNNGMPNYEYKVNFNLLNL